MRSLTFVQKCIFATTKSNLFFSQTRRRPYTTVNILQSVKDVLTSRETIGKQLKVKVSQVQSDNMVDSRVSLHNNTSSVHHRLHMWSVSSFTTVKLTHLSYVPDQDCFCRAPSYNKTKGQMMSPKSSVSVTVK